MKDLSNNFFNIIKASLSDRINLYLLCATLLVLSFDLLIWQMRFAQISTNLYWRLPISPVKYSTIVVLLNLFLSLSAYDKDKNISYLLLAANIFITLLVFVLELFYLKNI